MVCLAVFLEILLAASLVLQMVKKRNSGNTMLVKLQLQLELFSQHEING